MSFESLVQRLDALQASNLQLKDLIKRLATINLQPGSVPVEEENDNVLDELTLEIHQTLKDQEEDFELLQEEVEEWDAGMRRKQRQELDKEKYRLEEDLKRSMKELKRLEGAFRKAQLSAKRNLEAARRAERDLLLQSYAEPRSDASSPIPAQAPILSQTRRIKRGELSKEEKAVNAASDVTQSLRRTHDMMLAELSRSQFAHDTLKESTAALDQLSETYSTLDTLLSSSRNLLGTLLKSQKSDTWYLETAFYVLSFTIAWLVFRRILYGPTWWLLWLPLKMFFKGSTGILTTIGVIGRSSMIIGGSSVTARETIIHSSGTRSSILTMNGARAPNVNVGGGGRGAPMQTNSPQGSQSGGSGESISERVGRIIDDSKNDKANEGSLTEDTTTEEQVREDGSNDDIPQGEQIQRNPNKRMWEEDKEAAKEAHRVKDEL